MQIPYLVYCTHPVFQLYKTQVMEDVLIQNCGLNQGTAVQLVPLWKNLALK